MHTHNKPHFTSWCSAHETRFLTSEWQSIQTLSKSTFTSGTLNIYNMIHNANNKVQKTVMLFYKDALNLRKTAMHPVYPWNESQIT